MKLEKKKYKNDRRENYITGCRSSVIFFFFSLSSNESGSKISRNAVYRSTDGRNKADPRGKPKWTIIAGYYILCYSTVESWLAISKVWRNNQEEKVYNLSDTARQRQGSGAESRRWGGSQWYGEEITLYTRVVSPLEEGICRIFYNFFFFPRHCGLHSCNWAGLLWLVVF